VSDHNAYLRERLGETGGGPGNTRFYRSLRHSRKPGRNCRSPFSRPFDSPQRTVKLTLAVSAALRKKLNHFPEIVLLWQSPKGGILSAFE